MKRCKHGKLKKRVGRRVCRKAPARRRARRAKRGYRKAAKVAGIGLGTVGVMAAAVVGAYKFWEWKDKNP